MEFLPLILFLFIGVFVAAVLSRRTDTRQTQQNRTTLQHKNSVAFQPFDKRNARQQSARPIVQGSAYVVDGDTMVIKKTQIRLFGVDAPEINHPYGKKAKWALVSLCKGQEIRAEIIEKDDHGRTVARCYLQDDRDLSAEMVKLGMAIDWPKFSGGVYRTLETADARKKLWLADARQKGRMHVWERFEKSQSNRSKR